MKQKKPLDSREIVEMHDKLEAQFHEAQRQFKEFFRDAAIQLHNIAMKLEEFDSDV
jgi:hypothetical protein